MKNITEEKITSNLKNNPKKCPRFDKCSRNLCPLDLEANLRSKLPEEEVCPFCLKKKSKSQKGIRTQMPSHLLKFVPESNLKMLNKRNLKRWHDLHKVYATE